ncbi:MAG TPA: hypothetical protein VNA88_03095 [Candidatus Kapabacteria bacterium]|nr:hypothetical protein [Candidatus Kapabacteria bacterium]
MTRRTIRIATPVATLASALPRAVAAMVPTLLIALLLGSCSPGTDPGPCTSIDCFENRGVLIIRSYRDHLGDTTILESYARASFIRPYGPYMGFGVQVGRVRLNDVDLVFGDVFEYHLVDSITPLRVEPDVNVWSISGSGEIASFVDTATIPAERPTLLSPRPGDTISIAKGFTARWLVAAGDSGSYQLSLAEVQGGTEQRVVTIGDLPDSGSIHYSPSFMHAGPANVHLAHTRSHFIEIAEGIRITSTVALVERVPVVLID